MTYADEVLADGPSGFWRLNETSGTTVVDSSGNGRDGTYSGTPTFAQSGPAGIGTGGAVSFSGDDYAVLPISAMPGNDFTVEWWVKTTSTNGAGTFYSGAGMVNAEVGGITSDWGSSLHTSGSVVAGTGAPDTFIAGDASSVVNDDAWHYVAFTRTKATGALALWIDDAKVATGTGGTQTLSSPPDFTLGCIANDRSDRIVGAFACLATYTSVLPDARVAAHFEAGVSAGTGLTLDLLVPAIQSTLALRPYTPTDTSNRRGGRIRGGYAIHADNTDPVELPPAGTATRRDKALWYPDPDLVDGRPT